MSSSRDSPAQPCVPSSSILRASGFNTHSLSSEAALSQVGDWLRRLGSGAFLSMVAANVWRAWDFVGGVSTQGNKIRDLVCTENLIRID